MVIPAPAFTISKGDLAINSGCYYSVEHDAIILEKKPPSYASAMSSPPPPYVSIKSVNKKRFGINMFFSI